MTLTARILKACQVAAGLSLSELATATNDSADNCNTIAGILVRSGRLYQSGVVRYFRYFTNKADADAWDLVAEDDRKARMKESARLKRQRKAERARTGKPVGRPPLPKVEKPPKKKRVELVLQRSESVKPAPKAATVTWPENVKVTIAPQHKDSRYSFEPPPGWKGQITRDWMESRLQAAQGARP